MKQSSDILSLQDFERIGDKNAASIEIGAVYKSLNDQKTYMIKRMDLDSTVRELLGARISRLIIGESAPIVNLTLEENGTVHVASKYIENFSTIENYLRENHGFLECDWLTCVITQSGALDNIVHYAQLLLEGEVDNLEPIKGMQEAEFIAHFVNHGDLHETNRGVRKADGKNYAALIDFSRSLKSGANPINYVTEDFNIKSIIRGLTKITSLTEEQIDDVLETSFNELKQCYPQQHADLDSLRVEIKENLLKRQEIFRYEKAALELIIASQTQDIEKVNELTIKVIKGTNENFISGEAIEKLRLLTPERFKEIWPKIITQAPLGRALTYVVRNNEKEPLEEMLPNITDQKLLGKELIHTIKNDQKEIFKVLLLTVADQELLRKALNRAIYGNNKEMFEVLLAKIQKPSSSELMTAVYKKRHKMFEAILLKITDQEELLNALSDTVWDDGNRNEMLKTMLAKITDQDILGKALSRAFLWPCKNRFKAILSKVTSQNVLYNVLTKVLDDPDRNQSEFKELITARIAELEEQTIYDKLKKEVSSTILDFREIPAQVTSMPIENQHVMLHHPELKALIGGHLALPLVQGEVSSNLSAPIISEVIQNASSQIALVGVVGHMIGNAAKFFYSFFNNEIAVDSALINHEAKDMDKKLLSLGEQFRVLHDKRAEKYAKFPSDILLEEINNLKALQDKATLTLERLENFNKLDKDGDKEDLQREATKIWKSYKKLKEAQKVINVKRIAAVREAVEGLKGAGVEQSERVSARTFAEPRQVAYHLPNFNISGKKIQGIYGPTR